MDRRQSQGCKFKEIAKHFEIKKKAEYTIYLRKLVDKMCKYEMDPASIVEDTGGHVSVHRWTYGD